MGLEAGLRLDEHACQNSLLGQLEAAFRRFLLHRANLSSRDRIGVVLLKISTIHHVASYVIPFCAPIFT